MMLTNDPSSPALGLWRITGQIAQITSGQLTATVDPARPDLGLQCVRVSGRDVANQLLGVGQPHAMRQAAAPLVIEDTYQRGIDLVVTYAESPSWPVRWQVYWRVLNLDELAGAAAGMEAIVSTQTSLLDSQPTLCVQSRLLTDRLSQLTDLEHAQSAEVRSESSGSARRIDVGAGVGVFLSTGPHNVTTIHLVHPADYGGAHWSTSPTPGGQPSGTLCFPLFERSLEKGVILRARVRALIADSSAVPSIAIAGYRQFLAAPLPLTT